ncbi:MAG: thioredoxin family protein [Bacillota bacterium]|nr:thioredoxin family protein [Bacillota bacterium]
MKPDRRFTRRDLVIIALLLLCAVGIAGYRYWQRSMQAANPLNLGGLPGVVVFSSSDCAPCIAQKEILEALAPRYQGRAKLVRADVYQHLELALGLGVQSIPTLFFIDADGNIVAGWAGLMPAEEIMAQLESMGVPR